MTNAVYIERFAVDAHCGLQSFADLELGQGEDGAQAHLAIFRVQRTRY
jgi:hypothetical protein